MGLNRRAFAKWAVGLTAVSAPIGYIAFLSNRREADPSRRHATSPRRPVTSSIWPRGVLCEDMPFVQGIDIDLSLVTISPDGSEIALASRTPTTVEIFGASYPPSEPTEYVAMASIPNATRGVNAMAWCRTSAGRLAFIAQQTRSYEFPPITSDAELEEAVAAAKLTDEDYELVLYSVNRDGSDLRRICTVEDGPINGRAKKGNLVSIAWPSSDDLYYYASGSITKVNLVTGTRAPFYQGGDGRRVRGVFCDHHGRIGTYEYVDRDTSLVSLVILDNQAQPMERSRLAECEDVRTIPYPLYSGAAVYADVHSTMDADTKVKIIRFDNLEAIAAFPDHYQEWTLYPVALHPNGNELICRAWTRQIGEASSLPGRIVAEPLRRPLPSKPRASADEYYTHKLSKLVRVSFS
jgi:hypothetical protein